MFYLHNLLNSGSQMTTCTEAPRPKDFKWFWAGLREKAVPGVMRDGMQRERGSAEPALRYSPSQAGRGWVEAASFKTKAKQNKVPDGTS